MKQILYVENDKRNARLVARCVADLPLQLTISGTATLGINQAKNRQFDLILLDVFLPDTDIDSFVDKLLKPVREAQPEAVIAILTAFTMPEYKQELAKLGYAYFSKPIDTTELYDYVCKVLNL